jgi:Flp pilus assembly protein TadG
MKNIFSRLKNEKGQSAVEFALVVILLFLLVFGIIEFGMYWFRADLLKGAANIAARTYAVTSGDAAAKTTAGQTAANSVAPGTLVNFATDPTTTSVTAKASQPYTMVVPGLLSMVSITNITRTATYRLEP